MGAASARLLAGPGRRLWLLAKRGEMLDAVARDVRDAGAQAEALPCDLADAAAVARAFERVGPRVDVLVNAAALPANTVAAAEPAEIMRVMAVNLVGAMLCAREAALRMPAGGTILNVGSLCVSPASRTPSARRWRRATSAWCS